jgi:hypothetical protein
MTGQIADQFAQRKIVATEEFLERTGRVMGQPRVGRADRLAAGRLT